MWPIGTTGKFTAPTGICKDIVCPLTQSRTLPSPSKSYHLAGHNAWSAKGMDKRRGTRISSKERRPKNRSTTQTAIGCPSDSPLLTVFPVFLMVSRTVSYDRDGSVTTSAVWESNLTSKDLTPEGEKCQYSENEVQVLELG